MKAFRGFGPVGALLDEYERAINEFSDVVRTLPLDRFSLVIDELTNDPDCVSFETIINHVLRSGYGYIGYMAEMFGEVYTTRPNAIRTPAEAILALDELFRATEKWVMNKVSIPLDDARWVTTITTQWNAIFDFESMMEHAIVHVLRHRRQLEKFLSVLDMD